MVTEYKTLIMEGIKEIVAEVVIEGDFKDHRMGGTLPKTLGHHLLEGIIIRVSRGSLQGIIAQDHKFSSKVVDMEINLFKANHKFSSKVVHMGTQHLKVSSNFQEIIIWGPKYSSKRVDMVLRTFKDKVNMAQGMLGLQVGLEVVKIRPGELKVQQKVKLVASVDGSLTMMRQCVLQGRPSVINVIWLVTLPVCAEVYQCSRVNKVDEA
jgi:hypothetical protein